ncbi:MAG: hypothetical protein HYU81_01230 [Candidatus Brennerbacteria bacterium]|nr:hypothetical protein [Candidatus Brennerbacteria bacterium]
MESVIGLKEFRMNLEKYARAARRGIPIVVMRRSKPIFRVSQVEDDHWEEVIDFTKISKGGVNINDLLSRL